MPSFSRMDKNKVVKWGRSSKNRKWILYVVGNVDIVAGRHKQIYAKPWGIQYNIVQV